MHLCRTGPIYSYAEPAPFIYKHLLDKLKFTITIFFRFKIYFRKEILPLEDPIHADCILPGGHIAGYVYDAES